MGINILTESVITLTEATRHLPNRRRGKKPHVATLYRWAHQGLRGIRLETIQVGGTLCTSHEALQRFFERLSNRDYSQEIPVSQQAALQRADAELDRMGFV